MWFLSRNIGKRLFYLAKQLLLCVLHSFHKLCPLTMYQEVYNYKVLVVSRIKLKLHK